MLRKITSIVLAVSFVALSISGLAMLFNKGIGFQHTMHPVHEVFGLLMVIAGVIHFCLNSKSLVAYLRKRSVLICCVAITLLMLLLFGIGFMLHGGRNSAGKYDTFRNESPQRHGL